jgi:hypothetical protein
MNRTIISNKMVKEIRQDGIVYLDSDGNEQFIDFEQCYQNHLKKCLSPEGIEDYKRLNHKADADVADHIASMKKWWVIADRNVLGDGVRVDKTVKYGLPYFEFYTEPRVRIEFESKDELWVMRNKLEREYHWRTFDLT